MKTLFQHLSAIAGPTRTHRVATIAFVALAAIDAFNPARIVTNSWWLILLLVWLMPWPRVDRTDASVTQPHWISIIRVLLALAVLAWLYLRLDVALRDALSYWLPFRALAPGPQAFSFTLQDIVTALAAGLLIGVPMHRIAGKHAVGAALLVITPWLLHQNLHWFTDTALWASHFWMVRSHLFEVLISALVLLEVCSLLVRRSARPSPPDVTNPARVSLANLRQRFTSNVIAMIGLLAATIVAFVWFLTLPRGDFFATQLHAVLAPLWAIVLTVALVTFLRSHRRRSNHADKSEHSATRIIEWPLSLVLLAPLWFWAILHAAPVAGASMNGLLKNHLGASWNVVCNEAERTVVVDAEFYPGFADRFRSVLDTCPDARTVILFGSGGLGSEGETTGLLIKERGLATRVKDYCASACTHVFAGGNPRILDDGAVLSFHSGRYHSTLLEWLSPKPLIADLLRQQGVSDAFQLRVAGVPHEDGWEPSNEELLEAGYVTEIRSKAASRR